MAGGTWPAASLIGAGEAVEPEMYTDNGHVTEFRFGTNLYANFNSQTSDKMQVSPPLTPNLVPGSVGVFKPRRIPVV